jgi:peptide/nickel transport system permease protein
MLVFIFALIFVVLTFLADLLNAWVDPRIRLG